MRSVKCLHPPETIVRGLVEASGKLLGNSYVKPKGTFLRKFLLIKKCQQTGTHRRGSWSLLLLELISYCASCLNLAAQSSQLPIVVIDFYVSSTLFIHLDEVIIQAIQNVHSLL